tara:strand:- start:468 stop:671 length:204 start_codon:yes stop_codon:yes gene_type:complete
MSEDKQLFESVHNYTRYKLIQMLINRLSDGKTKLDDMNSMESLADDILRVLSIAGMKYYSELKREFK